MFALALATAYAVELGHGYSDHSHDTISYSSEGYDIYDDDYDSFGYGDDDEQRLHKRSPLLFLPPFKLLKKLYLKAKLPFPIG